MAYQSGEEMRVSGMYGGGYIPGSSDDEESDDNDAGFAGPSIGCQSPQKCPQSPQTSKLSPRYQKTLQTPLTPPSTPDKSKPQYGNPCSPLKTPQQQGCPEQTKKPESAHNKVDMRFAYLPGAKPVQPYSGAKELDMRFAYLPKDKRVEPLCNSPSEKLDMTFAYLPDGEYPHLTESSDDWESDDNGACFVEPSTGCKSQKQHPQNPQTNKPPPLQHIAYRPTPPPSPAMSKSPNGNPCLHLGAPKPHTCPTKPAIPSTAHDQIDMSFAYLSDEQQVCPTKSTMPATAHDQIDMSFAYLSDEQQVCPTKSTMPATAHDQIDMSFAYLSDEQQVCPTKSTMPATAHDQIDMSFAYLSDDCEAGEEDESLSNPIPMTSTTIPQFMNDEMTPGRPYMGSADDEGNECSNYWDDLRPKLSPDSGNQIKNLWADGAERPMLDRATSDERDNDCTWQTPPASPQKGCGLKQPVKRYVNPNPKFSPRKSSPVRAATKYPVAKPINQGPPIDPAMFDYPTVGKQGAGSPSAARTASASGPKINSSDLTDKGTVVQQVCAFGLKPVQVPENKNSFYESVAQQARLIGLTLNGDTINGARLRTEMHCEAFMNRDEYYYFFYYRYDDIVRVLGSDNVWEQEWEYMVIHMLKKLGLKVVIFRSNSLPIRCDGDKCIKFGEHIIICRLDNGFYSSTAPSAPFNQKQALTSNISSCNRTARSRNMSDKIDQALKRLEENLKRPFPKHYGTIEEQASAKGFEVNSSEEWCFWNILDAQTRVELGTMKTAFLSYAKSNVQSYSAPVDRAWSVPKIIQAIDDGLWSTAWEHMVVMTLAKLYSNLKLSLLVDNEPPVQYYDNCDSASANVVIARRNCVYYRTEKNSGENIVEKCAKSRQQSPQRGLVDGKDADLALIERIVCEGPTTNTR